MRFGFSLLGTTIMDSFEFDNVKAEKEAAMRRYNKRKFFWALRLTCELLVFLFFFFRFSGWIPDGAFDFCRKITRVFESPLFIFLLLNAIIFLVYVLSGQKPTAPPLYDEYVESSHRAKTSDASPAAEEPPLDSSADEQTVQTENVVPPAINQAVAVSLVNDQVPANITVTETKRAVSTIRQYNLNTLAETGRAVTTVSSSVGTVGKLDKKRTCMRSQSELSDRSRGNLRRELLRSDTTVGREVVARRSTMDDLSNEEFRLQIERFIAEKKKVLIQENMAVATEARKSCMAIVVSNRNSRN